MLQFLFRQLMYHCHGPTNCMQCNCRGASKDLDRLQQAHRSTSVSIEASANCWSTDPLDTRTRMDIAGIPREFHENETKLCGIPFRGNLAAVFDFCGAPAAAKNLLSSC